MVPFQRASVGNNAAVAVGRSREARQAIHSKAGIKMLTLRSRKWPVSGNQRSLSGPLTLIKTRRSAGAAENRFFQPEIVVGASTSKTSCWKFVNYSF